MITTEIRIKDKRIVRIYKGTVTFSKAILKEVEYILDTGVL